MFYLTTCFSPLGRVTLASDGAHLTGLWFEGQKYFGASLGDHVAEKPDLPVFSCVREWLDAYFAGEKPPVSGLPLAAHGGTFRKAVWDILRDIPYGEYMTYGEIARKMAFRMNRKSMSSQAVGGAVGHNPISIIIPCHRVLGSNGSLTGYAGGISKKIRLLELEGVNISRFSVPVQGTAL